MNNVKQIALALINYEAAYGSLPPAYTTDSDGRPLHSWRVLILPFIEEQSLYDQLDLTKPWHDPQNLALASKMPRLYQCPSELAVSPVNDHTTAYVAIIGPGTVWPRNGSISLRDIPKGTSNTLLVIESESERHHWMSTADTGIESLGPQSSDGTTLLSHGLHNGASSAVYCDGHCQWLDSTTSPQTLSELFTTFSDKGS